MSDSDHDSYDDIDEISDHEISDIEDDEEVDDVEDKDDTCVMNLTSNHRNIVNNVLDINPSDKKCSQSTMTKYEITKVLGLRAQQICEGAEPMIQVPEGVTDSTEIAILELRQKKIPLALKVYQK